MFVVPMLWFWLASDARPSRALYSGCLNLEFDVLPNPLSWDWVLLVDKLQRAGYPKNNVRALDGPCFTGPEMPCSWTSKHAATLLAKFTAECTSIS